MSLAACKILQLLFQAVAAEKAREKSLRAAPIVRAVGMTLGYEAGAGIEHLVLRVTRRKLRADCVPGELEEFHALAGRQDSAALRAQHVIGETGVGEVFDA